MTDALYLNDSYLKEFDATIESVTDGKYVVLDRTAFYPKGGGQDCDTGKLIKDGKEYEVVFVGKFDGKISHEVKNAAELKEGDKVKGLIDWERRHKLMRCHTAEHVLSAIVEKDHHALVTGNELTVEKCRSDYNLETFDREKIDECFRKANEAIQKDFPIEVYFIPMEEAVKDGNLFKLETGFKHTALKEVRIVDIKGLVREADGGTHVRSLKEVGKIELLKCENRGKGRKRVYFTVK